MSDGCSAQDVPRKRLTTSTLTLTLAILPALLLLLRGLAELAFYPARSQDLHLYQIYGKNVLHGEVPYQNFRMEYPPLAILDFVLPLLLAGGRSISFNTYSLLYLCQNVALCLALGLILRRMTGEARTDKTAVPLLAAFALAVLLEIVILPWRYDLFPATLTLLAFQALVTERAGWAGMWLGLGTAAKLYPIILLPVFGLFLLARREMRQTGILVAAALLSLAATALPFLVLAPHRLFSFMGYQAQRGLQIESLPGGLILLADKVTHRLTPLIFNFGSWNLVSPLSLPILRALPLLFVLLYAIALWRGWMCFQRSPNAPAVLAYGTLTALLAFIAANKVFSPQYVIWLLPFLPLLPFRFYTLAMVVLIATALLFPILYPGLLALHWGQILLLNLRNAGLAVLLLWMLRTTPAKNVAVS